METVPIDLPDGTRFAVRLFPAAASPAPVVVIAPGVGVPASYFDLFADDLVREGLHVAVFDLRGQGSSTPVPSRSSNYGYHDLVSVDFPAVLSVVRDRFPSSTPYLLGHSLGGQLSAMYAARIGGEGLGGVILVASGTPYYGAYPGALSPGLYLGATAVSLTSAVAGYWPGDRVRAGGFGPQSSKMVSDWGRVARSGRYAPRGADVDYEKLLAQVQVRVLSITIEGDSMTPKRAARHLVGKMTAADVTRWHQPKKLGHNTWIVDPAGITGVVARWAAHPTGTRRPGPS